MSYFTTDGYKYLQAGSGVIPASGDFTVSVTAKLAASYDPRYGEIISQGKSVPDNSTPTVGFYLGYVGEIGGGINYLTLRVGDSWQSTRVAVPTDSQWHTYQVVKNGNSGYLYLDGRLAASTSGFKNPSEGSPLRIGAQFENYGEVWNGQIDNVRIYDAALNASELNNLMALYSVPSLPATSFAIDFSDNKRATVSGTAVTLSGNVEQISASGANFVASKGQFLEASRGYIPESGDFTVSVMAKLAPGASAEYGEILSQGASEPSNTASRVGFYLGYERGKLRAGDSWQATGIDFPADSDWHLYQITKSGSTAKLYIDGRMVGINTNFKNPNEGSPLRIGAQFGSYGEYWNGEIDNLRIYNTALTYENNELQAIKVLDFDNRKLPIFALDFSEGTLARLPATNSTLSMTQIETASYRLAAPTPVNEGSTAIFMLSTSNVLAGSTVPYTITGVSATDVIGGQLSGAVTVGANGQAVISISVAADNLTEGAETLTVTAQGQSASVTINDTSLTPQLALYALSANSSSTNEGATATFTLSTTNVAAGTAVPYTITGVSASDVVGSQLSGSVNVGTNGQAIISVPLVADMFTEGPETLTVTAGGQSASVTILDTSTSPIVPTYAISASTASVQEGSIAIFNLITTNIAAGTGVNYLISGVSEADVVGGVLSGSAIIDTNGRATISVPIAADSLTEGTETLRVIVSDKTATMTIADTSVATTSNTTNITNNITNNVINNTTNNISGNVNNITNNFINSFNRTLKVYDASVTNDVKVVVTKIGDITRIEGNQENNTLVGTDAIDRLVGGGGSDRFYSSKGNDVLDGGDGTDAVTFKGNASDFRLEKVGSNWLVRDTRTDPSVNQGEDTLTGIERVAFQDKVLALDTEGTAGKAYRVYKAAFNRDPMQGDTSGLGYWIGQMDSAMDLIEVSARFVDSKEFRDLYGTNPTNAQFLTKLYQNVLGRAPEATGYNWWLNELNTNPSKTKAKVLADFSESGENQTSVAALIGDGIAYEPWVG